jgi:SAM-dependent methyltransferase
MSALADIRERSFALVWSKMSPSADEEISQQKKEIFGDLPERVVEIGPGYGSNFAYYDPGTTVVAFEPNRFMHDALREAAVEHQIDLDLRESGLAEASLPDASEDAVVSTLVLCSIPDRGDTVAEVRRILRPGGRLYFVEHVAGKPRTARARWQRIVRQPWRFLGGGCDVLADTHERLEAARFSELELQRADVGPKVSPTRPHVWGIAVR